MSRLEMKFFFMKTQGAQPVLSILALLPVPCITQFAVAVMWLGWAGGPGTFTWLFAGSIFSLGYLLSRCPGFSLVFALPLKIVPEELGSFAFSLSSVNIPPWQTLTFLSCSKDNFKDLFSFLAFFFFGKTVSKSQLQFSWEYFYVIFICLYFVLLLSPPHLSFGEVRVRFSLFKKSVLAG